ncbi:MAG: cache domain-containing protein, partial [Methanocorpusculum sp.]|nr:cache domain-containing protein [Methanocorpusculum sp.]
MEDSLDRYISVLEASAAQIDRTLISAADNLSAYDVGSDEARSVLRHLYANLDYTVATVYYDRNYNQIMQVPWTTTQFKPEQVAMSDADAKKIHILGPYINEWFGEVFAVSVPVFAPDGSYKGRVAAFFKSNSMILDGAENMTELSGYYLIAVSPDGVIIASPHKYLIGSSINDKEVMDGMKEGPGNSGITHTTVFNVMTHNSTPMTAIWKTADVHGSPIYIGLGKYENDLKLENYLDTSVSLENLTAYVRGIYTYAGTHAKNETLEYINGLDGLTPVSLYSAFAISYEGDVLAMAEHAEYIGRNLNSLDDSYGIPEFHEMRIRALQGGGYVHFFMDTSLDAAADYGILNMAYVIPVGSEYFVGASIPVADSISEIDSGIVKNLRKKMSEILNYFYEKGKYTTIDAINEGAFGSEYVIGGASYTGVSLAHNLHPESVGVDFMQYTDSHGDSISREMVMIAKRGGGVMYYCYKLPDG